MTLIETLATIVLIGLAVLIATSLVSVYPRIAERTAARHELLRVLDATVESVRCGSLPLTSGEVPVPIPCVREVSLVLSVQALEPAGLYDVTATACTEVRGEPLAVDLQTMVWSPR